MFQRLLIANRGEIACRIIKTAKVMGIETVSIYSDADRGALHTRLSDIAVYIGPSESRLSYLDIEKIVQTAKDYACEAIHPGYGFLSENAEFAKSCAENGITFVGAPIKALTLMGDKAESKRFLESRGVPMVPGYHGKSQKDELLHDFAKDIGFPVMLKAVMGGGGKGMRVCWQSDDFLDHLHSCRREALSSFGDDTVIVEKYIAQPRHIEIQVFADSHGNVVHLHDRDCSVQRRHQKIVEEAPAPNIPDTIRQEMADIAVKIATDVDYVGAGTVEFILDAGQDNMAYYFLEMNTRLQVEHPVTEMITGIDLVKWQLLIAADEDLPMRQDQIPCIGHSLELRLYAEDSLNEFLPATGAIQHFDIQDPDSEIRVDTGIDNQSTISAYYDPMVAKIILHADSRDRLLRRAKNILKRLEWRGPKINLPFLHFILSTEPFQRAEITSNWLDQTTQWPGDQAGLLKADAVLIASLAKYAEQEARSTKKTNAWALSPLWRIDGERRCRFCLTDGLSNFVTHIHDDNGSLSYQNSDEKIDVRSVRFQSDHIIVVQLTDRVITACLFKIGDSYQITLIGHDFLLSFSKAAILPDGHANADSNYYSPMPGSVVQCFHVPGDEVEEGEVVIIVEAMKMEYSIKAKRRGIIEEMVCHVGDQVTDQQMLFSLKTQSQETE